MISVYQKHLRIWKMWQSAVHSKHSLKQWIDLGLLYFTFDSVDGTDPYFMPMESEDYSPRGDCSSTEYSHQTTKSTEWFSPQILLKQGHKTDT
jgi:hypothetical protein